MIKVRKLYKHTLKEQEEQLQKSKQHLSREELKKVRDGKTRLSQFIDLIKKGHNFELMDNTFVKIDPTAISDIIKAVEKESGPVYIKILMPPDSNEKKYLALNKFRKDKELGGKEAGSGEKQERITIGKLSVLIANAKEESGSESITIEILGYEGKTPEIIEGVNGVVKLPPRPEDKGRAPKTDFVLTTTNNKREYYFISHKAGSSPKDCLQYSGVTAAAGVNISSHPEVVSFLEALLTSRYVVDGRFIRDETAARPINDPLLKRLAVFGPEYGKGSSLNNADAVVQGDFVFTRMSEGVYRLSANHIMLRKDYEANENQSFGEGYEPTLMARSAGRNLILRGDDGKERKRINGTRVFINPRDGRIFEDYLLEGIKK